MAAPRYAIITNIVAMRTVTFRMDSAKVKELDRLATAMQRDRDFLLNEAVTQYLSLQRSHLELIQDGLLDAKAGRLTSHRKVVALTKTWNSSR
jgi:predicted transcriptional regulator